MNTSNHTPMRETHLTNRELLESAARAGGIEGQYESWTYQGFNEGIRQVIGGAKCQRPWNPLIDDGDALRLTVKLHMTVRCYMGTAVAQLTAPGGPAAYIEETDHANPGLATRRAIVRAAAAAGGTHA